MKINEQITVLFWSLVFQFVESHFGIRPVQCNIQYFSLKDVVCVTSIILPLIVLKNNSHNMNNYDNNDNTSLSKGSWGGGGAGAKIFVLW
jgi:hypothetical protein